MQQEAQREHQWLQQLAGEWTFESDCDMGPDKPREKAAGRETVRPFGSWIVAEGEGGTDGGWKSIMTLGYDPAKQRFVGTFVATMMTHLWIYEGTLDAAGTTLTLDTEGPNFTDGKLVKYQDIITFANGRRQLKSQMMGDDGQWHEFMSSEYRRPASKAAGA